jgi:hypothetical protein
MANASKVSRPSFLQSDHLQKSALTKDEPLIAQAREETQLCGFAVLNVQAEQDQLHLTCRSKPQPESEARTGNVRAVEGSESVDSSLGFSRLGSDGCPLRMGKTPYGWALIL